MTPTLVSIVAFLGGILISIGGGWLRDKIRGQVHPFEERFEAALDGVRADLHTMGDELRREISDNRAAADARDSVHNVKLAELSTTMRALNATLDRFDKTTNDSTGQLARLYHTQGE